MLTGEKHREKRGKEERDGNTRSCCSGRAVRPAGVLTRDGEQRTDLVVAELDAETGGGFHGAGVLL